MPQFSSLQSKVNKNHVNPYKPYILIVAMMAYILFTVNSEIFARVLFSRNFGYTKFHENKILAKCRNHCRLLIYVNHDLVANS